jgi:hypothetical protein
MYGLFDQLCFPKKGSEIIEKAKGLADRIESKIEERKRVISKLAEQLGITDVGSALMRAEDIGLELSAENSVAHSKMLDNRSKATKEREELRKLKMVIRNLPADKTFDLKYEALDYFGF